MVAPAGTKMSRRPSARTLISGSGANANAVAAVTPNPRKKAAAPKTPARSPAAASLQPLVDIFNRARTPPPLPIPPFPSRIPFRAQASG